MEVSNRVIEICQDNGGDCREYGPFNDSPVKDQWGQIRDLPQ
jgi:hypothetical protein